MKLIICISLVIKFLYDEFLTYLDYSYIDKELPGNIKDVYNEDEYKKWKVYQNEGKYIGLAEDIIDFLFIFCFILFNVHSKIFYMFDVSDEVRYLYTINYMFAFVIYGYLIWIVDEVLDLFSNVISRKHEYEADAFATSEGYGVELIKSLKKLYKEDFSDINPHPLVVKLSYSHPTLSQRIQAINRIIRKG